MDTDPNASMPPQVQLADKLKAATYVLVTVSQNPSVDQLAALIGLTLLLNKQGKHAAAVYSGKTPSTLEFLQPADTIEKTTDSLRDFIIALDKSKADKLRYKVEDNVVRIFITPYKTSINEHDLEFSQGDFNVDVVVALGVSKQEDLDEAIIAHGRILHDATVATINTSAAGDLGSIHWQNSQASSLSEMVTLMGGMLGPDLIDNQIATALLTGIVAETARFSNEKTTSQVMSASATLMAAGANQQLVANELEKPALAAVAETTQADDSDSGHHDDTSHDDHDDQADDQPPSGPTNTPDEPSKPDDGSFAISHDDETNETNELENHDNQDQDEADEPLDDATSPDGQDQAESEAEALLPEPVDEPAETPDDDAPEPPQFDMVPPTYETSNEDADNHLSAGSKFVTEPPTLGGELSANTKPEALDPSSDPLSAPTTDQDRLLSRNAPITTVAPTSEPLTTPVATPLEIVEPVVAPPVIPEASPSQPLDVPLPIAPAPQTLSSIEAAVEAVEPVAPQEPTPEASNLEPATVPVAPADLDSARDEVLKALGGGEPTLEPVAALNAQPMMDSLHAAEAQPPAGPAPADDSATMAFDPAAQGISDDAQAPTTDTPTPTPTDPAATVPTVMDPNAAPPVPPPIPFNFGQPAAPAQ